MIDANSVSAKFDDLLLTITRHDECWRARVEEIDDPKSALSDGTDYASTNRAKLAVTSRSSDKEPDREITRAGMIAKSIRIASTITEGIVSLEDEIPMFTAGTTGFFYQYGVL